MDTTALIVSRLDVLERHREADKAEAKADRHGLRNDMVRILGEIEGRMTKLELSESAAAPAAENAWMKWALGIEAAVIGFFAYLIWGHK